MRVRVRAMVGAGVRAMVGAGVRARVRSNVRARRKAGLGHEFPGLLGLVGLHLGLQLPGGEGAVQ